MGNVTTGNSAAGTVNAATMKPGEIPPTNCQELKTSNENLRTTLSEDSSKSVSDNFGKSGATTVAHGSLNGGAPIGAGSRLLPSRYDKRVVEGLWAEKDKTKRRKKIEDGSSNLCPKPEFKYAKGYRPHQSHCESKILETLFSGEPKPKGTLLLNINWQNSEHNNSKEPCEACEELLCHAQKECGLQILLCDDVPYHAPKPLTTCG